MATLVTISIGAERLAARLDDSPAGRKLAAALPLELRMSRWGEEYYGSPAGAPLPIEEDETARELLEVGEIAFWPPGNAVCLFFGPTPASTDARPRAASAVVPLGRITSGAEKLRGLGGRISARIDASR